MTIKEKVLEIFELNKGVYFSGEEIAQTLGVSRAAIWKAVKQLQIEGYSIDAVNNKGYCLSIYTDILSPQGIQKYIKASYQNLDLHVLQTIDSTNTLVRQKADQGEPEGFIVAANEQTAGRGRYGRDFYSPSGTGLYFSLLLRPTAYAAEQAVGITTMAAVAMCEAIEEVSDEKPKIKWVNDIFIKGKKVCGILTEGSFGLESGMLEYAVLGAGVNLYAPSGGFPEELQEIAGAVFDRPQNDMKNRLVAAFINHFLDYYRKGNKEDYTEKYRQYSLVIGKEITVISAKGNQTAFVHGIDDECRLMVEYANGDRAVVSSGEIRIRL